MSTIPVQILHITYYIVHIYMCVYVYVYMYVRICRYRSIIWGKTRTEKIEGKRPHHPLPTQKEINGNIHTHTHIYICIVVSQPGKAERERERVPHHLHVANEVRETEGL